MFVDAESRRRVTIIPIEYGATFRGHFRLLLSGVEAGFLSEGSAGQTFSGTLCFAAQQRGSELHVPATAVGEDAGGVAGDYARRFWVLMQGAYAAHAHHETERGGRVYRDLPEGAGTVAGSAAAGSGAVPAGSGFQVRSQPAGLLSGIAAEGYE